MRWKWLHWGIVGSAVFVASAFVRAEWRNSLQPKGPVAGEVTLVRDGQATCVIHVAANASAPERRAAEEFQHWIGEITGARPDIAVADASPSEASMPVVVRIECDDKLGEGYRIAVENGVLVLTGGQGRGVVNAVYALLEEDVACRFYTNESIRLPKDKTLVVRPVARQYVPKLRLRDPYYKSAFDGPWSLRNRTNAPHAIVPEELGGRVDYGGMFVHTAAYLVPPSEHFSAHPEYFFMDAAGNRSPAQVCATNPDVLKIATAHVLNVLEQNPHAEIISISKNDNAGDQICRCERCTKLRADEGGTDMACQLVLVNGMAEAVEREYPNVTIDTLAYLETIGVPKTMRPRKNVAIRLCNDTVGAWARPFTPARECPVAKLATAWAAAHDRIYIWDYTVNFSHYLAPMPNVDVMADNIRFWVENNAEGVMLQGGYQGPAERDELKCWVTSKLLWDPSRNADELVQDFIWGHYGAAAPAMAEYEALLAQASRQHATTLAAPASGIRYPMDAPFLSKEFLDKATEIFQRAKQQASGDEALQRRVERAELPILYVKCARGRALVGQEYGDVVAEFERIARREQVICLAEGGSDLEAKLAAWKAAVPKPEKPAEAAP